MKNCILNNFDKWYINDNQKAKKFKISKRRV